MARSVGCEKPFTAMRTLSTLALLLFVAAPLLAQDRTMTFDHPLRSGGVLVVDTYKGSVDVEVWDKDEVEIDVRIAPDEDSNDGDVDLVDVRFDASDDRVSVETDYERLNDSRTRRFLGIVTVNNGGTLPLVHYTIRMPRSARLNVDDYKSEITIAALDADVTVESYKGTIRVDGARNIDIDTYKGTARVRAVRGGANVDTYKGDVEIAFADLSGRVTVDTYKGDVRLIVPYGAGFALDADLGRKGNLDTDLPIDVRDGVARGRMGGGGPAMKLETYKGTLHIDTAR